MAPRTTPPPDAPTPRDAAHDVWWRTFEVVYGVPVALSVVFHLAAPWSLRSGQLPLPSTLVGVALLAAGVMVVVRARSALRQHRQPTEPGRPTTELVTTGAFAVSRNPLYLGGTSIVLGVALVFDLPWSIVALLPATVACHYLLIVPEERYLMDRFGSAYEAYAARVGRWIGRTK